VKILAIGLLTNKLNLVTFDLGMERGQLYAQQTRSASLTPGVQALACVVTEAAT